VTGAVFKTVCGAVLPSWVGSIPMSLRQPSAEPFAHGIIECTDRVGLEFCTFLVVNEGNVAVLRHVFNA
jgi:hypothetical protein